MALPSSACGGSLPAPGTAAALQTRPVGWRWLEESSAHRHSALAAQLPGPEPPALSQQCRGRHAVFMQRFAARCVCSAPGSASLLAGLSGGDASTAVGAGGRGGREAAARPVQQPRVGPVSHDGDSVGHTSGSTWRVPPVLPDPPGWLLGGCAKGWGVLRYPGGSICLWCPCL